MGAGFFKKLQANARTGEALWGKNKDIKFTTQAGMNHIQTPEGSEKFKQWMKENPAKLAVSQRLDPTGSVMPKPVMPKI